MRVAIDALVPGLMILALVRLTGSVFAQAARQQRSRRVVATVTDPGQTRAGGPGRRVAARAGLERKLASAGLAIEVDRLGRFWWRAGFGATLGVLLVAGPGPAALLALASVGGPLVALHALAGRAEAGYDIVLAGALDAAARSVRSGASLAAAIGEAAPTVRGAVAADLQRVAVAVDRGAGFVDALESWARRRPRPAVRLAAGAIALAAETGGPPGRVLDEVATALRQRHQVEREAHALAAQARLSGVVVGVAPVAFALLAGAADPRNARAFTTPVGLLLLSVGLALDATGALWMHRISRSVSPW